VPPVVFTGGPFTLKVELEVDDVRHMEARVYQHNVPADHHIPVPGRRWRIRAQQIGRYWMNPGPQHRVEHNARAEPALEFGREPVAIAESHRRVIVMSAIPIARGIAVVVVKVVMPVIPIIAMIPIVMVIVTTAILPPSWSDGERERGDDRRGSAGLDPLAHVHTFPFHRMVSI
jgi:hypothetical protein